MVTKLQHLKENKQLNKKKMYDDELIYQMVIVVSLYLFTYTGLINSK